MSELKKFEGLDFWGHKISTYGREYRKICKRRQKEKAASPNGATTLINALLLAEVGAKEMLCCLRNFR